MPKIINIQDVQKSANKVVADIEQVSQHQNNIFEILMKEIEDVNPALGGFEELGALLALSDEHFSQIAPVFLDELQKSFNNINDKMFLVQAMNTAGLKSEDIQEEYLAIIEQIDNQMTMISPIKRDFLKALLSITYNSIADAEGIAKKVVQIPIELCHEKAKMPTYANIGDAGLDVYALEDITIHPGETKLIKTGLKVAIPYGYELQVRPKSGRALKTKFRVANTPGTIDSGYRDEIGVIIDNIEPPIADIQYHFTDNGEIVLDSIMHGKDFTIGAGEKFAQLVLNEVPKVSFYPVENITSIAGNRGGGFGSSGVK